MIDEQNRKDDETEYHFSEEDISFDEQDTPKAPATVAKTSFLQSLSQRKRMLISLSVFFVLLFIVYKIVAPSSSSPHTEIIAQAPTNTPQQAAIPKAPSQLPPPLTTTPQLANQAAGVPANAVNPPSMTQTVTTTRVGPTQQTQPTSMPTIPNAAAPGMPSPQEVMAANNAQAMAPSALPAVDQNDKIIREMQAAYLAKLDEFAAQNRLMQDQMQTMNARVSSMENQLNQLVQALMRVNQPQTPPSSPVSQAATHEVKSSYNVQAIIPGRAWLRSESGETVTVAEGDTLKDLGRITEIDPYDGIVEINTGNKVISLSYGSTG